MSILQNSIVPVGSTGYDIDNSLRFNDDDSAYLSRTPSTAGNRKTWTWSGWVKRGNLGVQQHIFSGGTLGEVPVFVYFNDSTYTTADSIWVGVDHPTAYVHASTTRKFRDVGAWYHIIVVLDTTQAVATNRIKLYVNGELIPSSDFLHHWSSAWTQLAQNSDRQFNAALPHKIGARIDNIQPLDGYLAEVNFIDGQALTPADFGETDEDYGHWKPIEYAGTYGTNGFYLDFSGKKAIEIDGQYDYADSNLAINTSNAFTTSGWANIPAVLGTGMQGFFGANANSESNRSYVGIRDGKYWLGVASTQQYTASASALPVNEWFHWAVACSGSTATYYINGVQVATMAYSGGSLQNATNWIGHVNTSAGTALNADGIGLHKEVAIWTSQLTTANVVSLYNSGTPIDATTISSGTLEGYWKLDETTGITAADSSGNSHTADLVNVTWGLGADSSGNSNNWLTNNLAATDQMLDSPTNNFCTLNPLDDAYSQTTSGSLSEGNLDIDDAPAGTWYSRAGTLAPSSGKWYFEILVTSSDIYSQVGIHETSVATETGAGVFRYRSNGNKVTTGYSTYGANWAGSGAVIGVRFDLDSGSIKFYKGNTSQGSFSMGTVAGNYAPVMMISNGASMVANFGQDSSFAGNKTAQGNADGNGYGDFYYAPPTGYLALCTQNLPEPTVVPSEHFNTVLYTGDGTDNRSITGVGFQPDFTWNKARSNSTNSHRLFDAIRGGTKGLMSDDTGAEYTDNGVKSFLSDGFVTSRTGGNSNGNGWTYVSWNWKANGTGVSNTDGTITSTVSANADAGFSIVSYTATAVTGTIGLGLATTELVIIKRRDAVTNWMVLHKDVTPVTNGLFLDNTAANFAHGGWISGTFGGSTLQLPGGGSPNAVSGEKNIAYCFHSVEGYSKVGSYTGNGSTDGTFVYTGFRPAYVMIKRTDVARNWVILDTTRDNNQPLDVVITANGTSGDNSNTVHRTDFLSNGFKLRNSDMDFNVSGSTYIFLAFAESPFKHTNAR